MSKRVRWGVLGTARIATHDVIPAMQRGEWPEIVAIASRDHSKAKRVAAELGIPKSYGSYEELLADPQVEAVYNPLPNHLHTPWSIRAAEAGKHVLCEKPVALIVAECRSLITARDRAGVLVGEAFMVCTHPQWLRARELVQSGEIGEMRSIVTSFGYFNRNPEDIRNVQEYGGGALMDIGCYAIFISRFLFGEEPLRVRAVMERDPEFGIDRLTSAVIEFSSGQSIFTCGTQLVQYQRVQILGSLGRIEIEIPFNAPPDRPCRLFVDVGGDKFGTTTRIEEIPASNQYGIQGDGFSRAIRKGGEVAVPLENSLLNMAVIDAIVRAARTGAFETPQAE
jgi:predicted dehydrogenase